MFDPEVILDFLKLGCASFDFEFAEAWERSTIGSGGESRPPSEKDSVSRGAILVQPRDGICDLPPVGRAVAPRSSETIHVLSHGRKRPLRADACALP